MNATTAIGLPDAYRVLISRKWLIAGCGLLGAMLALALSIALPPQYRAEGNLVVRSQALTAPDNDAAFTAAAVNEAVVTTEKEVIVSHGLLERVAASVNIPPEMLSQWSLSGAIVSAGRHLASLGGTQALEWFDEEMQRISPPPTNPAADLAERRTQFVAKVISIKTTKDSSVIRVRATTGDAQLSADIVNRLLQLYMQDRNYEQNRTAQLIEQALRERQTKTKTQISEAEDRLTAALAKPGAIEANEIPGLMRDMSQLSARLTEARAELAKRESDYNTAVQQRDATKGNPIAFADAIGGGRLPLLRQQYDNAQQEIAKLPPIDVRANRTRLGLERQLNRLALQITAEANRVLEQRRSSMLAARDVVARLDAEMQALRTQQAAQAASGIGVERERGAVASLWRSSDAIDSRLIDLAARPANPNARILSNADVPTRPAFPSKAMFSIAGFILGSFAAGGFSLVTSRMRGLRLAAVQVAEHLNVPFLGGVPRLREPFGGSRRLIGASPKKNGAEGLVQTLSGVVLELEEAVKDGQIQSLLVTSGRAGEGKTTVAAGLSRSLAMLGLHVLLVDLDLRRPRAETMFAGASRTALDDETIPLETARPLNVKVDQVSGLHIFTPYPVGSDALSTLRSESLQETLTAARDVYQVVLLDTPPLLLVPDALVAARFSDAIVLVTESGRSDSGEIDELSRRLARTGRPIRGVIVTKVERDDPAAGVYAGYP